MCGLLAPPVSAQTFHVYSGVQIEGPFGNIYRVFPVIFKWIGDYLEQSVKAITGSPLYLPSFRCSVLLALTRQGNQTLYGSICCHLPNHLLHDLSQRCADHNPRTQKQLMEKLEEAARLANRSKSAALDLLKANGISDCLVGVSSLFVVP